MPWQSSAVVVAKSPQGHADLVGAAFGPHLHHVDDNSIPWTARQRRLNGNARRPVPIPSSRTGPAPACAAEAFDRRVDDGRIKEIATSASSSEAIHPY